MGTMVSFVSVRHASRLSAILTLMVALLIISLASVASADTVVPATNALGDTPAGDAPGTLGLDTWSCPDNLLLNPSFESGSGFNLWGEPYPNNWTHSGSGFTGATMAYGAPHGSRIGYVIHTSPESIPAIMYQQVTAVPGTTYEMTFYSGTHEPSKQPTIAIRFYDSIGSEVGTAAIHTITSDLEVSGWSGPYTLSATAPAGAATLRVIFTDPASTVLPFAYAGAKGDALCLKVKIPNAVSLTGFSTRSGKTPLGGMALLGVALVGLAVSRRRPQQ
jgi:hypothetical protein